MVPQPLQAVLFDLDGTLIDSAPDLAGAANLMRAARGLEPLPYEQLRGWSGMGARGLLQAAFDMTPEHPDYLAYREEYLHTYETNIVRHGTYMFDGVAELLALLQRNGVMWGIVTNKFERYAHLLAQLVPGLSGAGVIVGGDTTPEPKPSALPMFEAARRLGVNPTQCVYVGDDERDVVAGRAAGMVTVACTYGYLSSNPDVNSWNAHAVVHRPHDLAEILQLA